MLNHAMFISFSGCRYVHTYIHMRVNGTKGVGAVQGEVYTVQCSLASVLLGLVVCARRGSLVAGYPHTTPEFSVPVHKHVERTRRS